MMKWDLRMLTMAQFVSTWSKDPSTKVGAVITDENYRVISLGYNGFPQGFEDKDERLMDRDFKLRAILHGERNAMIFAQRSLEGCFLFTYPFMPCEACASMIAQHRMSRVVSFINSEHEKRYDESTVRSIFSECNVKLKLYPKGSLA